MCPEVIVGVSDLVSSLIGEINDSFCWNEYSIRFDEWLLIVKNYLFVMNIAFLYRPFYWITIVYFEYMIETLINVNICIWSSIKPKPFSFMAPLLGLHWSRDMGCKTNVDNIFLRVTCYSIIKVLSTAYWYFYVKRKHNYFECLYNRCVYIAI